MEVEQQKQLFEALLFAKADPVTLKELERVTGFSPAEIEGVLSALMQQYQDRGIQLVEVAEGYQFRTNPAYGHYLSELLSPPVSVHLSRAAMETLAMVAYRQPVSRREIEQIRGVDSSGVLQTLTERGLLVEVGRGEGLGRPVLYGTTPLFLQIFGLKSLQALPPLSGENGVNVA